MIFTFLSIFSIIVLSSIFIFIALFLLRGREKDYVLESYSYYDPAEEKSIPFEPPSKPASKYLSIIVPAYNEEKIISIMLDETIQFLQEREKRDPKYSWEIVIVDDGSRDRTCELVLDKYVKRYGTDLIRLNKLQKNVGKGGAVRRVTIFFYILLIYFIQIPSFYYYRFSKGMLVGRGKYLIMVDADGATKFSDLEKLERKIIEIENNKGEAVVVGSRVQYHPEELS